MNTLKERTRLKLLNYKLAIELLNKEIELLQVDRKRLDLEMEELKSGIELSNKLGVPFEQFDVT